MNKFNELYESFMGSKKESTVLKHFKNTKLGDMVMILKKYEKNANDISRNSKGNYDITIYEL